MVAVHLSGLPGERPGLGSNLHHAVKFIMQDTSIPMQGTIVTKLDGNCWMPKHFLCQLETLDETLCFQTMVREIHNSMEEYDHLSWFMRAQARVASSIHTLPTHVFYLSGFQSAFCMPLAMICRVGNWDPWLIQEDNSASPGIERQDPRPFAPRPHLQRSDLDRARLGSTAQPMPHTRVVCSRLRGRQRWPTLEGSWTGARVGHQRVQSHDVDNALARDSRDGHSLSTLGRLAVLGAAVCVWFSAAPLLLLVFGHRGGVGGGSQRPSSLPTSPCW